MFISIYTKLVIEFLILLLKKIKPCLFRCRLLLIRCRLWLVLSWFISGMFFFVQFPFRISINCAALPKYRSSRPDVFCKKGVLSNFTKFTGKHLCHRLFFNKVAGLRPVTLLKKRLGHRCFPVNFSQFLGTPLQSTSGGYFCWLIYRGLFSTQSDI